MDAFQSLNMFCFQVLEIVLNGIQQKGVLNEEAVKESVLRVLPESFGRRLDMSGQVILQHYLDLRKKTPAGQQTDSEDLSKAEEELSLISIRKVKSSLMLLQKEVNEPALFYIAGGLDDIIVWVVSVSTQIARQKGLSTLRSEDLYIVLTKSPYFSVLFSGLAVKQWMESKLEKKRTERNEKRKSINGTKSDASLEAINEDEASKRNSITQTLTNSDYKSASSSGKSTQINVLAEEGKFLKWILDEKKPNNIEEQQKLRLKQKSYQIEERNSEYDEVGMKMGDKEIADEPASPNQEFQSALNEDRFKTLKKSFMSKSKLDKAKEDLVQSNEDSLKKEMGSKSSNPFNRFSKKDQRNLSNVVISSGTSISSIMTKQTDARSDSMRSDFTDKTALSDDHRKPKILSPGSIISNSTYSNYSEQGSHSTEEKKKSRFLNFLKGSPTSPEKKKEESSEYKTMSRSKSKIAKSITNLTDKPDLLSSGGSSGRNSAGRKPWSLVGYELKSHVETESFENYLFKTREEFPRDFEEILSKTSLKGTISKCTQTQSEGIEFSYRF